MKNASQLIFACVVLVAAAARSAELVPVITEIGAYQNTVCVGSQCAGTSDCNWWFGYRNVYNPAGIGCAESAPGNGGSCTVVNHVCYITYGYGWGSDCSGTPGTITYHYKNAWL
jgi:hypothetical protein